MILPGVSSARVAFGLLELVIGIGLVVAGQRVLRRAHEKGGRTPAAHLVLRFLGVLLTLYGLLQLLFAPV